MLFCKRQLSLITKLRVANLFDCGFKIKKYQEHLTYTAAQFKRSSEDTGLTDSKLYAVAATFAVKGL